MASRKEALDVPHGAADLDDGHIGLGAHLEDGGLDLIGDVGDDLDRAPR